MSLRSHVFSRGLLRLTLLLVPASLSQAITVNFEGAEYTSGSTAVGVNDASVYNSNAWQYFAGTDISAAITASTARPAKGARALRIVDNSASQAYVAYLDTQGEFSADKPFTLSFSLAASGVHATTGTLQAQVQFGRTAAQGWNDYKSWLHLDFHGNDIRLFVYDPVAADRKKAVVIGQHNGAYVRISATIDPVLKKYSAVSVNGTDVTSIVQSQNGGTVPWRADVAGDPNFFFWLTTGADDLVTVDLDEIRMAQTWTAQEDAEWKPYIQSGTNIKIVAGSALDFSDLYLRPAIDARGFAFVGRDGDLAFSDGAKARLLCAAESVDWLPFNIDSDAEMDAYVTQLRRSGYNCFRPHFLDHFLMDGATADLVVNPTRYTIWQKLVKKLKDNGIYLLMDATTSWSSYYKVDNPWSPEAKAKRLKTRVYWDQTARDHWLAAVTKIYTDVNPYTGTALKDDPQVIASCLRNEAGLVFQLQNDDASPPLATESGLLAEWRLWLSSVQTHYANIAALNSAWGTSYASFNDVPLPAPSLTTANYVKFRDLQKFSVNLEQATFQWLLQKFRGLGVKSLVFDYNADPSLPSSFSRDVQELSDFHTYHDHGYSALSDGYYWRHKNNSSCDDSLSYVRLAAQARQWGRPFVISEWGHVYWNPWRHEGGLAFPSYAALQGWSMIAQHGHPVSLTPKVMDTFNIFEDPPRKASERMAALLYARGDVATSPNSVVAEVPPLDTNYANNIGIGSPLMHTALLTRVGHRVNWPVVIRDSFDDSSFNTLTEKYDPNVPLYFWNASVSGGTSSSATTVSGSLVLRAADIAFASAMAWGGSTTYDAFNFFNNQTVFSASGISFDSGSAVAADKQVLRFALTSNINATYGAADCVTLEITADNKVVLGYKVDAPSGSALNVVETITDISTSFSAIEGFSLNPNASDLNELVVGQPKDPTYDLVIYYRAANDKPAYKRYTGRWKKQVSYPALAVANWGSAGNCILHFEAQKTDGAAAGWIKASVGEFKVSGAPSAPAGTSTLPPASYAPIVPVTAQLSDVVQSLRNSGVLATSNQTVAATGGANNGVYHSDTEQIRFEPQQRSIRIVTPRSQGATLPSGMGQVTLPNLQVTNLPAPTIDNSLSVFVSALNGSTVQDSSRLLFILSTDALNNGQKFEDYHRLDQIGEIPERGELPILLKRTNVSVSLLNDNHAALKVYPLNPDGSRRAALSTTSSGGRLNFSVDTGTLPGGPAVYFEITP